MLLQVAYRRAVRESSLQLVTVSGEPGVGKTRLVVEFSRSVDTEPGSLTWRQGRCLPYGEGITFWALGEILKAQAGILESDPAAVARLELKQLVGSRDQLEHVCAASRHSAALSDDHLRYRFA